MGLTGLPSWKSRSMGVLRPEVEVDPPVSVVDSSCVSNAITGNGGVCVPSPSPLPRDLDERDWRRDMDRAGMGGACRGFI